jgi:hypothetical protein
MTDDLRPEILADLTRARGLSPEQGDALLDATPAERDAVSRLLLEQTRDMLEQAGLLQAQRSILEIDLRRVTSLAGVYGIVGRWWDQPGWRERSLGDLLKVIPADQATLVHSCLVWGGWLVELPPEAEEE